MKNGLYAKINTTKGVILTELFYELAPATVGNFVSLSKDLGSAREGIINNIDKLNWDDGFYRKDIGYKVID